MSEPLSRRDFVGADTMDAAIEGVKIQELDPEDRSVGYGGVPNEDGVIQLDAARDDQGASLRDCAYRYERERRT